LIFIIINQNVSVIDETSSWHACQPITHAGYAVCNEKLLNISLTKDVSLNNTFQEN
jgi:hypothetical protein